MIQTISGDLLSVNQGIIVHGCNRRGVMGAGIAKEIKEKYPAAFSCYIKHLKTGGELGTISTIEVEPFKIIVNALTQENYGTMRRQTNYEALALCFEQVVSLAYGIYLPNNRKLDICFPRIGCGLGGGDWNIVSSIIDSIVPSTFNKKLYIK